MEFPDIDETIKRIQSHRGVQGVIIATKEGFPIRTTMDNTSTVLYIANMMTLEERAASMVRDIEPTNALLFLRIRSRKFEIMASADKQKQLYKIYKTVRGGKTRKKSEDFYCSS